MKVLGIDTATSTAGIAVLDGDRVLAATRHDTTGRGADLLVAIDQLCRHAGVAPLELDAIAIGAGPGSFTGLRIGMATAKGIAFAARRPLWAVSSLAALADDAARHLEITAGSPGELRAAGHRTADDAADDARSTPSSGAPTREVADAAATNAAPTSGAREVADAAATSAAGTLSVVIVAALDARRGEVFAGCFCDGVALGPERVLAPEELRGWVDELVAAQVSRDAGAAAPSGTTAIHFAGDAMRAHGVLAPLAERWLPIATPSGEAVARRALAGTRENVLLHGAPSYIRPSEAEVKYPDGVPGALRRR